MKRSDFFIRLTTGVLFLAVACYIGIYLYNWLVNVYETIPAVRYSIGETLPAHGFIVRSESVIEDSSLAILPLVSEGEKVAAGQVIAIEYMTTDALEMASEIRSLRLRIAQLESFRGNDDAASFDAVIELSSAVITSDLRRLDEIVLNVETTIFSTETDISSLRERLEYLEGRNIGTRTITAQVSGTFSNVVDGFEHITPDMLYQMSPQELIEQLSYPVNTRGSGKLITDFKWYYAAIMAQDDAIRLSTGQTKTIQFYGAYNSEVDMVVESISRRDEGLCVVLFSSDRGLHEVTPLRELRADILLNVVSGIRVPMEAIHLDNDSNTFIYLQTSGLAEKVDVEILDPPGVIGDSYLVRDGEETGSPLRVDSIIIVRARDLFPGKAVP
jgi:hypothetical protein